MKEKMMRLLRCDIENYLKHHESVSLQRLEQAIQDPQCIEEAEHNRKLIEKITISYMNEIFPSHANAGFRFGFLLGAFGILSNYVYRYGLASPYSFFNVGTSIGSVGFSLGLFMATLTMIYENGENVRKPEYPTVCVLQRLFSLAEDEEAKFETKNLYTRCTHS